MRESTMTNAWLDNKDPAEVEAALVDLRALREAGRAGDYFAGHGQTDERFALWLWLCDRICLRKVGVGIFDIADWRWADAFGEGLSPAEAVQDALSEDDTFAAMFEEENG